MKRNRCENAIVFLPSNNQPRQKINPISWRPGIQNGHEYLGLVMRPSRRSNRCTLANRRLNRISVAIGIEEVTNAFREAEDAFAKSVDQRTWRIFMEGTKEEQERFQEEVQETLASGPKHGRNEGG
jgi:hypothetical protein